MLEIITSVCLLIGAFFTVVGSIGLVRLPEFFMRLHAPTKASTLGVGGILLASMAYAFKDGLLIHELIITLFVFLTAPVSAQLLSQAALRLKLKSKARLPE
ncbi:Na+/H+ antiporter subunit G [Zwartia sp.]|uniref:Na+/H+ antiporter subunit G n=1 Tax=Zwartia sp. TaxID=2978004 RepID=UPI003BAE17EE